MDTETWRFINTFAPWFSAIGTILAVITSLYLASRNRQIRLEVDAKLRPHVHDGSHVADYVAIRVVNHGHRAATIQSVGWRIGFFRKQQFTQLPNVPQLSRVLPTKLEDGEYAFYLFSMEKVDGTGWRQVYKPVLNKYMFPKLAVYSMKAQVDTSIGKTFEARIERKLRDKLTR